MGYLNVSQQANDRSWKYIKDAFAKAVPDGNGYTLCYGFWMKSGLISRTMYNYSIGFNTETKEIVLVPIDSDGNIAGDTIRFQKSNVSAVSKTLQGFWKITSSVTEKPIILAVPGMLPDSVEDSYQLPINQLEQAEQFMAMMKGY